VRAPIGEETEMKIWGIRSAIYLGPTPRKTSSTATARVVITSSRRATAAKADLFDAE